MSNDATEGWSFLDNSTDHNVSVVCIHGEVRMSVAQADEIEPGIWWVARVKVHDDFRRKGLGKQLACRMVYAAAQRGAKEVRVVPGGYNIPADQQRAFYAACGFRPEGDEGLMVWRPPRKDSSDQGNDSSDPGNQLDPSDG